MDTRRLAAYAYHNCEFQHAIALVQGQSPSPELAAVHVKALCELDDGKLAAEVAEHYRSLFPQSGILHHQRGLAYYLAGRPKAAIEEAFFSATECDCAGGNMGLALLAFTAKRSECAVELLKSAGTGDAELEHIRQLMMAQAHMGREELTAAEERLRDADRVLRGQPSLLRQFWGQLCWARLMRSRGLFEGALAIVERMLDQIDEHKMPRLHRNAMVEKTGIIERESHVRLKAPKDPQEVSPPQPRRVATIAKKPMLHSLYQYLAVQGGRGASKEEIVTRVWEESYNPMIHDDRIYKAIGRLRKLLGDDQSSPRFLTQLGRNYVLTQPAEPVEFGGQS